MRGRRLTPKQRTFVREYLTDLNATQAAIRAGYSQANADKIGPELLGKTRVKRAIQEGMKARAARLELTADMVLRELMLIGFSNVADYHVTDMGHLKARRTADRGAIRAVASFKRKSRTILGKEEGKGSLLEVDVEVKLWNKVEALKAMAQHLGITSPPDLPPLETILNALPAEHAGVMRGLLSKAVSSRGGAGSN